MAEFEQRNRDGNESSGRINNRKASGQGIPNVDFEQMNFEQRRAPYNSGSRTLTEKEYNEPRDKEEPGC